MRQTIANLRLDGKVHSAGVEGKLKWSAVIIFSVSVYSYFQSGSSGCFKSHNGRALRTAGTVSKLYSGGGEVVAHSSVHASQGSSPAFSPFRNEVIMFNARHAMPAIWKMTPMDVIRFNISQPRPGS